MIEVFSPQQPLKVRKITRKPLLTNVSMSRWLLPLILVFQALLAWTMLQNTAFQDEALYVYAGQQIWQAWLGGPPVTDPYSSYFSGYPYVYPVIGGALNMLGGLELVRAFSLLCMLIVTTCGYYVTKKLFDQKSAVFAAIFLVCQGPILFLSRLATYDPLCLCLLALATALAVNAGMSQRPWRALGVGPLLVLAFFTKYVALIFIPSVLAILVLCFLLNWGWKSMLLPGILALLSLSITAISAAALVLHFDPQIVNAIANTSTNRVVIIAASHLALTEHVIIMIGLSYVVGLTALIFTRKRYLLITLLLLGTPLLLPGYHIYKGEQVSLDKHLGFSMFFLMPLAGYALASLSGFRGRFLSGRYWLSGVAICLMLFLVGTQEARDMYAQWPNTSQLAYVLDTQVRPSNGRYLMEQFEVSRYNLRNDTYNWQWDGLDFFEYKDKLGRYYVNDDAYVQAVKDGYFDVIQLNYGGYYYQRDTLIAQAIKQSKKYTLIEKIPYDDYYGPGYFWVWRKN